MSAMDLPTTDTLAFVEQSLPDRDRASLRLLEVGCGAGHLAAALQARGHRVVAVDSSEEAITVARGRGVDARLARFPELGDTGTFDAVLFTRSLHHIPPIDDALAKAHQLLVPGGRLIVDDFAHNRVDRATAAWAFGYMKVFRALGLLPTDAWDETSDPLGAWQQKHTKEHSLHDDETMLRAAAERFELGPILRLEYFYRYPCRYLDEHPSGRTVAEAMRWAERALLHERVLQPIGLRFTGRAR